MSDITVDLATFAVDAAYAIRKALGRCKLVPSVKRSDGKAWEQHNVSFKPYSVWPAIQLLTEQAAFSGFRRFGVLELPVGGSDSYSAICDGVCVRAVFQYTMFPVPAGVNLGKIAAEIPRGDHIVRLDILASK